MVKIRQVFIWDVEAQPNRHAVLGAADSRPDLVCHFCPSIFSPMVLRSLGIVVFHFSANEYFLFYIYQPLGNQQIGFSIVLQ